MSAAPSSPGAPALAAAAGRRRPAGTGRRPTRRVVLGLALLALAVAVLAGCGGAVGSFVKADSDLAGAGFQSPNVTISSASLTGGGPSGIVVGASLGAPPTKGDFRQVASIIWNDVHYRFDYLEVSLRGGGTSSNANYTFQGLQQTFGARPAAWNSTTLKHSLITLGAVALSVGVVVVAGVVVLIVFLVRRRRHREAAWLAGGAGGARTGSFGATGPPSPPPGCAPIWYPPDGPPPGSYPPPAYPYGPYAPPRPYPPPGPYRFPAPPPVEPDGAGWPAPAGRPTPDRPPAAPPSSTPDGPAE